jgi:hypothetical protein
VVLTVDSLSPAMAAGLVSGVLSQAPPPPGPNVRDLGRIGRTHQLLDALHRQLDKMGDAVVAVLIICAIRLPGSGPDRSLSTST